MNKKKLATVLRKIAAGSLSRSTAAAELEISERHVNRIMRLYGVRRPKSAYHARRAGAGSRREDRARAARQVINGQFTHEQAALAAGCSVRTVYRWAKKLTKLSKNRDKALENKRKSLKTARK